MSWDLAVGWKSALHDGTWELFHTMVNNLRLQNETLAAATRSFLFWIGTYGHDTIETQGIAALVQLGSAPRYVFGVEYAGGGGWNGFLEEAAVQHLHGSIDRRSKHLVDVNHGGRLKAY